MPDLGLMKKAFSMFWVALKMKSGQWERGSDRVTGRRS